MAIWVYTNAIVRILLALYLFMAPALILLRDVRDPALSTGEIPRFAFSWHRQLSEKYESWARQRVALGKAGEMSIYDISGTEWPVFGSVFYLWATESLQEAWEKDPSLAPAMPKEYARGAIEAAVTLVTDPNHAAWANGQPAQAYALSAEALIASWPLPDGTRLGARFARDTPQLAHTL